MSAALQTVCILRALLPACYLAASWTWVIGMYLPVYLARDFGWPSFIVFAVPNVIGAMLVGFLLRPRTPGAAPALEFFERHRAAIHWFSLITIALHLYFCGVLVRQYFDWLPVGPFGAVSTCMASIVAISLIFAVLPQRMAPAAAAIVLLGSVAFAISAALTAGDAPAFSLPPLRGTRTQESFLPLVLASPAILVGFLMCPYLDATILRIRRDTRDPVALYAFILGFAGFFLLMILLTLGYAGRSISHGTISYYIVGHILVQSAFTMSVHAHAMVLGGAFRKRDKHSGATRPSRRRIAFAAFALALMPMLGTASPDLHLPFTRPGYPASRLIYDCFMGAYAIVFPAYLWICAVPCTPAERRSRALRLRAFALACLFAVPCLALGVIVQVGWAIPLAIAAVLATPWLLILTSQRRAKSPATS